jgi:hypothetical protein
MRGAIPHYLRMLSWDHSDKFAFSILARWSNQLLFFQGITLVLFVEVGYSFVNPLTPELYAAQRYLTRFFTGYFAS